MDITVVRNAMANQIGALASPSLRMAPDIPDQINPPCAVIGPGRNYVSYATTLQGETGFGGVLGGGPASAPAAPTDFSLDVIILLSKASTQERVEAALDQWLGMLNAPGSVSVPAAIMADPTLGGSVAWCIVNSADAPGPITWSGLEYYGTRVHCQLSAL